MGEDNNQQLPQENSVPDWFSPPTTSAPTPTSPKPKRRLLFILIIAGIALLASAIAAIMFFAAPRSSTCLDASDYKALTGIDLITTDVSSKEIFYDNYLLFQDGGIAYDNSTEGGQYGDSLIKKIADFYKSHPDKPMLITISASYSAAENEPLTNQRIATVRSSLLKAGVADSNILAQGATLVEPEDAAEGNADSGEISIAITADTTCK